MKFLLVLVLYDLPYGFAIDTHIVNSKIECEVIGERWTEEMTVIFHPENQWRRSVSKKAEYKCIEYKEK